MNNPENDRGTTSVLVTDAETRPALAVVRSLGRRGHEVHVCSTAHAPLAAASRFATSVHRVRSPLVDPLLYVQDLADVARETGVRYVMPITDPTSAALLPMRERLAPTVVLGPSAASFFEASDKGALLALAPRFDLRTPPQATLDGRLEGPPADLVFPVVVKPHRSTSGGHSFTVRHAADRAALLEVLQGLPDAAYPLLLQHRITGPGIGIFILRHDGQTVARFAHRRLVEQPASGGGSAYSESVPLDEALTARVEALLAHLDWEGPAMVEFKVDSVSGEAYLMEINGRFWGSLQLAIDAGVDFPAIWLDHVINPTGALPAPGYATGIRVRSITSLVDHVADRLLHSPQRLSLPANIPSLAWVIAHLMQWHPRDRFETLRLQDPGPFLREIRLWAVRRLLGR